MRHSKLSFSFMLRNYSRRRVFVLLPLFDALHTRRTRRPVPNQLRARRLLFAVLVRGLHMSGLDAVTGCVSPVFGGSWYRHAPQLQVHRLPIASSYSDRHAKEGSLVLLQPYDHCRRESTATTSRTTLVLVEIPRDTACMPGTTRYEGIPLLAGSGSQDVALGCL